MRPLSHLAAMDSLLSMDWRESLHGARTRFELYPDSKEVFGKAVRSLATGSSNRNWRARWSALQTDPSDFYEGETARLLAAANGSAMAG